MGFRKAGFTLIEVMVASVILGMTVSAVVFMVLNSSALRLSNDHNRQARAIAQEELEDPAHHFLNYTMLGFTGDINLDPLEGSNQVATIAHRAVVVTEVLPVISGITTRYKLISSTVTWSEDGRPMSVTLQKRIAETR